MATRNTGRALALRIALAVALVACLSVGIALRESKPQPSVVVLRIGDTLLALSGLLVAIIGGLIPLRANVERSEQTRLAVVPADIGCGFFGLAVAIIWGAKLLMPLSEGDTGNLLMGATAVALLLGWSVHMAIRRRR